MADMLYMNVDQLKGSESMADVILKPTQSSAPAKVDNKLKDLKSNVKAINTDIKDNGNKDIPSNKKRDDITRNSVIRK